VTIRMQPVLECGGNNFLPLSDGMDDREVGTAVAVLVSYLHADADDNGDEETAVEGSLRRLLDLDGWVAPGGLLVHDSESGVTFTPGCCCGLESWREWLDVRSGKEIWLGHDPTAEIEHVGAQVRLRWEADARGGEHSIEFPRTALTALLLGVQQDLGGFLNRLADWADVHVPVLAQDLVARFDEEFAVTARMEL